MVSRQRVGVLALQGETAAHLESLARAGVAATPVRRRAELRELSHLVLPGGESTTLHHLLELFDLGSPIAERHRAGDLALFGTCAGAILLGRDDGERPPRMGLLDARVERNGYGRQVDSFAHTVRLEGLGADLRCVFIRAPRLTALGPGAEVLGRLDGDPILVRGPGLLAATFHPELGVDPSVHRRFLEPDLWDAVAPAARAGGPTPGSAAVNEPRG